MKSCEDSHGGAGQSSFQHTLRSPFTFCLFHDWCGHQKGPLFVCEAPQTLSPLGGSEKERAECVQVCLPDYSMLVGLLLNEKSSS